jgi:hypothetical protein
MPQAGQAVLNGVLQVMRPLARLLLRHGIGYPVLAAGLKKVFLDAARDELAERDMPATDSAVTLLCGVHRRDVRLLTRLAPNHQRQATAAQPLGLAGALLATWLADPRWRGDGSATRALPRAGEQGFDALAASLSQDIRPRALLDELLRLGLATEAPDGQVALAAAGFAPRGDLAAMAAQMAANLHDHAAAAVANLAGEANHLEQALYVDELGPESVQQLRRAATAAWREAFQAVMGPAQRRFDADQRQLPAAQRRQRVRFGAYFFSDNMPQE